MFSVFRQVARDQRHRHVWSAPSVGWGQRRFAAPAHHDFSTFSNGGPAIEASWSHPTLNKAMALGVGAEVLSDADGLGTLK